MRNFQEISDYATKGLSAKFLDPSKQKRCPAVLVEFAQNRAILLSTEPKAQAKYFRQPRFWDCAAVECLIQEQVERTVVPFDYFETPVPVLS
jgi:hypothetical protein